MGDRMDRKRWPTTSPRVILIITLGAAAAVFIGGLFLARRDEHVRLTADRKPVQAIGEALEGASGRLLRLYEKHLRRLASVTETLADDPLRVSQQCDAIVGVVQWSLVHGKDDPTRDVHQLVDIASATRWPRPVFQIKPDDAPGSDLPLSEDEVLKTEGVTWGWIDDPGKPLLFWQRTDLKPPAAIVLTIDPQPLHDVLNAWFTQWASDNLAPLRVRDGVACALRFGDATLASTRALPSTPPDFILPVHSLFGTWEIVAWDRVVVRTSYDARTLAIAGFLSGLIVVLGVLAYLQQKRLLAQTAQQVTFINRVSHELRSPLTNILLNLELSQEMLGEQAQASAHRLALVQEEALRLRRLVDNVLAFSALEREKYRWENRACVPDELVRAVIDQFAAAFVRRGLRVRFVGRAGVACVLDADAVAQILANLLSNIEKYVSPGTVEITTDLRAEVLTVAVRDEGTGVPAGESERIFRPFERLDGGINEGASGTGLGLSIARELAIGMGGSLRLVPSRVGAMFELRVPAIRAKRAAS